MKLKQKKKTKSTLSDRIADALTLKPRADIEDDQVFGTKPQTVSRADLGSSDSEDEAAISDFRRRNVNLLSEVSKKYEGQVISRKDLKQSDSEATAESSDDDGELSTNGKVGPQQDSTDSENDIKLPSKDRLVSDSDDVDSENGESQENSIIKLQKRIQSAINEGSDDDDEEGSDNDAEEEKEDDDDDDAGYDISQLEEPLKEDFEHMKKQNISEEAKKGNCVRNQLLLWEGLLEMRIHLQRCMNTANQMPMPDTYKQLKVDKEYLEESKNATTNVVNVLEKLLSLQNMLLKKFPETQNLSNKKADKLTGVKQDTKEDSDEEIPSDTDNEEIPSDTEPEDNVEEKTKLPTATKSTPSAPTKKRKLEDYESELSTAHKAFKSFRDASIQKWNDKTRLATATNIKNAPTNTILQQISYILSDREKLVKRTQLKRSEYDIVGYKTPVTQEESTDQGVEVNPVTRNRKDDDEYIPEIFDDSDFYHQLLRELIECKSADISDPVQLSRQWIALQQMRSKMKRKVDTKATKGRKIKYVVHNKLVNYMAPEKCTTWSDESANELYSSLFGKMFEHNNAGLNGDVGSLFKLK